MNIIIWINLLYRLISASSSLALIQNNFSRMQNIYINTLFSVAHENGTKIGRNIWI